MTSDALRAAIEARLGTQYEVESLLGQGGMGSVFRAMDKTLHRAVAIKVISGDVATNPELKERFLLEARTVAKLRHPNIVAVYSAGEADGLLYFVMELVPGESLRDLLSREGTVEPARAERILHELAMALDYAHQNGIVHRDVKPENILLDRETGRAMLMDFGVARALERDGGMTGTGMILGSPRYMSPEQATGESTLDGRSDLYSLALVGYEMFTGKPVVESGNIAGMLVKHLTETPKPIAQAVPVVPEGTAVAIDRALAKDPSGRWSSGREMAEVIGMAWTPNPASGATRALAASKRRVPKLAIVGIAVTIVAAVTAVAVSLLGRDRTDPRKSYAVVPFEIQSGNADVQWLRDGAVNMLTLALSQWSDLQVMDYERTLKYVTDAGADGRRVDLDRAQEIARRGGAGTIVMGQISTTSDSLVVVARLYDVRSGNSLNTVTRATSLSADPRPLFDDLARYLLDVAGGATSASVDVARVTTTSLTAYRAYLVGVGFLNSWRLKQADSAFTAAIEADSTFALAWHKRSLALGWDGTSRDAYLASARRAAELSDRLPPRQQALVRGHHELAEGLSIQMAGEGGSPRARLQAAVRIYSDLLAQDSLVAEGWYGLADAYFHDNEATDSVPAIERRINASMRAFHRTLAIDSTFHLAYSHLVQQYQGLSQQGNAILIGDSIAFVQDSATLRRVGGAAAIRASQTRAAARGLEITRGWARADADAPTPHLALATSFYSAGQPDSSLAVIERALLRPALRTPTMELQRVLFQLVTDDSSAFETMREITLRATPAELRASQANERLQGLAAALNVAGQASNGAEVDRVVAFMSRVDPVFPFTNERTEQAYQWYAAALRIAIAGEASAEDKRILIGGIRRIESAGTGMVQQMLRMSVSIPYAAYLVTRDTVFSNAIRRIQPNAVHSDLDGLEALSRGDTVAARTIASGYLPPDSLKDGRFSLAGLRAVARAEVLAAVGRPDLALGYYEALDPRRFTIQGFAEPGFAAYTRTFAARARLYSEQGQRAKAIAAWEEFLERTAKGDELIAPARREATSELSRLRDSGR